MGLIRAAMGAAGGVMADQWKEYFYCEAMPADLLATRGWKRQSGRSANTKGSDNIISNGSIVAVADGQCAMIVEQGKVVDMCAEPGEYTYDTGSAPTLFSGDLSDSIGAVFQNIGKRFTFGGEAPMDQRAGIDIDIAIRCFGEYSYRITNPILFYTNVCGNVEEGYTRDEIDGQLKSELMTALQPAFAKISDMGIRYSSLPGHTMELAEALNDVLSAKWGKLRGIEIVSFGVSSVKASEEDEQMLKEMQRNAAFMDPTRAAAHLVGAQASAMQTAAGNQGAGPAMAFMGMNMAGAAGGMNAQNLYQMGAQQPAAQPAPAPAPAGWTCSCGQTGNTGKFCANCGSPKPAPAPAAGSWVCSCGTSNTGKFCCNCGSPKPAPAPAKCSQCGWTPDDPAHPPKFCPECGKPFGQ